ncbi:alpha/beta hydrolase family protein [Ferruginibacter sp. HRS2-29]|uniref:alpha/beta hydrolase n=1 Tax=Ferruginibacter sp. HRS2-29 TaxID=2487334 RepID=UPI0020CC6FEA|nr:alpha/beta hydrolase family protein [Ferruginibacter sp. HRS2-29]MCP9753283.1 esterase family protein [Ferruginibacter sp. HRS2-29]
MRILSTFLFSLLFYSASAQVDTISIFSNSMHRSLKCVVIQPSLPQEKPTRYPVVYLLHGYSGAYDNWIKKMPSLISEATENKCIIVCPDGGFSSWYVDSPVDSATRFETFISKELVEYIDKNYFTLQDKNRRAITGLSMGGHGALMLAMRHQDVFGAAASMSGAVDLNETHNKFETGKRLGDTIAYSNFWHRFSVIDIADTFSNKKMPLLIDCGTGDIFIKGNRALHAKLERLKIPHDYVERTGEHNWQYWTNALPYHLLFFRKFFETH